VLMWTSLSSGLEGSVEPGSQAPSKLDPMPNAAPEWQAKSVGWRSRKLVVACPLEGLVG
jgi:hypothetical protein